MWWVIGLLALVLLFTFVVDVRADGGEVSAQPIPGITPIVLGPTPPATGSGLR